MCSINSKWTHAETVCVWLRMFCLCLFLPLASSSPLGVRLIFLGCGQGLLYVFILFSSSPFSSFPHLYLFLCLSLCVNTHFVRHLPSSFILFFSSIQGFPPLSSSRSSFLTKHRILTFVSLIFFFRLSVCLRNGIQQQNDTCAKFPLLKVETVLRKKKKTFDS